MTIVEGQIETLKNLKESLRINGITRFKSVGEIRQFLENFESEKAELAPRARSIVEAEIHAMEADLAEHQQAFYSHRASVQSELNQEIGAVRTELARSKKQRNRNRFYKAIYFLREYFLSRRVDRLTRNLNKKLDKRLRKQKQSIDRIERELERYLAKKETHISALYQTSLNELGSTKDVIDECYPLIAGAIGESAVVSTLEKLPDNYYLINDFSLKFNIPIYNRKLDDRIYSIQIDHLLICRAGVFLLETKNWSKASIANLDLRSPVEQIRRTNFALFVLLNSNSNNSHVGLERHHWGERKIPIRNIIAMTNAKPIAEFKHVKVLSLNELNGYIQYFDQIFSDAEAKSIFENLKAKNAKA